MSCNIAFIENLPQGEVHMWQPGCGGASTKSLLQQGMRVLLESPNDGTVSTQAAVLQVFSRLCHGYRGCGKAALFIPGIKSVDDIAYLAVKQPGAALVWRSAREPRTQN